MSMYPKEIVKPKSQDFPVDWRNANLYDFMRNRSFRRLIYAAGAGSVFFVAWYLYRRYTEEISEEYHHRSAVSLADSLPAEVQPQYNEAPNNNNNTVDLSDQQRQAQAEPALPKLMMSPPVEDKVVIHCCPRGFFVPSIATEPLKLETFLRVANIPYEVNFCSEFETPLLTYGNKIGNDFRECVRILSEQFDVNLETADVTASRKTACHLVDISLENHFSWAILIWRWIFDEGKSMRKIHSMNALGEEVVPEVAIRVKEATRYHPIGQLDKAEFIKTICQGIHDISAALGKHQYFQGQTPGTVDCHAFAILVQLMWNMPGSPFENHLRKYGNLVDYIKRMREQFWPDWNELILKPREFQENFNAQIKLHKSRAASKSSTRKGSRSRDRSEAGSDDTIKSSVLPLHGIREENESIPSEATSGGSGKSQASNKSKVKIDPKDKKLPDPEAVKVIVKRKDENNPPPLSTESQTNRTQAKPKEPVQSLREIARDHPAPAPVLAAVIPPFTNPPAGILKTSNPTIRGSSSQSVSKPRSGFVNASAGSTKFAVDKVKHGSVPPLTNDSKDSSPTSSQHTRSTPDSVINVVHAHKPSVKFASADSTSVTGQPSQPQQQAMQSRQQLPPPLQQQQQQRQQLPTQQQQQQHQQRQQVPPLQRQQVPPLQQQQQQQRQQLPPLRTNTGGNYSSTSGGPPSQIPHRITGNPHPESAAQLTMKRSTEKPQIEQMRHSLIPNNQYSTTVNYATIQQRPQQNLPPPLPASVQDYHLRPQASAPPQQNPYYSQLPLQLPSYGQVPSYNNSTAPTPHPPPPQLYNAQGQPVGRGGTTAPPPRQGYQLPYDPQLGLPSSNSGYSFSQQALNPEELQKDAEATWQAHLEQQQQQMYQEQQHQQQQLNQYPSAQQQPFNNNGYNSPGGIIPNYVGQQYDPRNTLSSLRRI